MTESQLPTLLAKIQSEDYSTTPGRSKPAYFRNTRILPIMHVLALQKHVVEQHPELPEKLFRLYTDAKRWAQRWRRSIPSLVEAWPNQYLVRRTRRFSRPIPGRTAWRRTGMCSRSFSPIAMRRASRRGDCA